MLKLAFVNASVGLWCLLFGGSNIWLFRVAFVISILIFVRLISHKLVNIIFLTRTLFLGVIGYYPMLIKAVVDESAFFSAVERSSQGFEIVTVMYVATSLALLGNEIGLALGSYGSGVKSEFNHMKKPNGKKYQLLFVFSIPLVMFATWVVLISEGSSILSAAYASAEQGREEISLGVTWFVGVLGVLCMFLAMNKVTIPYSRLIMVGSILIFLGWGMLLHGHRQDVMSWAIGMFVIYKITHRKSPNLNYKIIIFCLIAILFFELWGIIRTELSASGFQLNEGLGRIKNLVTGSTYSDVYAFGTVSHIVTTFANCVSLTEFGRCDFIYGRSYFGFLLRTLPKFVDPDRPEDYFASMAKYGFDSRGGFFELGEAYLNFGLLGSLVVPFIISFFISRIYWRTFQEQTILWYFVLFSFLGVWFRGNWYTTFAFYKAFITSMVLYAAFTCFCKLLIPRKIS